jgi:hypothetical protein
LLEEGVFDAEEKAACSPRSGLRIEKTFDDSTLGQFMGSEA